MIARGTFLALWVGCMIGVPATVHSQCPDHVKKEAVVKDISELDLNGRVVFAKYGESGFDDDTVFMTDLQNWDPKPVEGVPACGLIPSWTPDGKWFLMTFYTEDTDGRNYKMYFISRDGTKKVALSARPDGSGVQTSASGCMWYGSPYDDPENKIWTMGYRKCSEGCMKIKRYDFSGDIPVPVADEHWDKVVAQDLYKGHQGFNLAGEHLLWDSQELDKGATVVYTLPSDRSGVTTKDMYYPLYGKFHCSAYLCPPNNGDLWVTNIGRLIDEENDCIPGGNGNHSGFMILTTPRYDDFNVDPFDESDAEARYDLAVDWVLDPNQAEAVVWAPESLEVKSPETGVTRFVESRFEMHEAEEIMNTDWHPSGWTNRVEYLNAFVLIDRDEGYAQGFVLHYPTNTWYRIGGLEGDMWFNSVNFDVGTSVKPAPHSNAPLRQVRGIASRNTVTVQGRAVDANRTAPSAKGIYILQEKGESVKVNTINPKESR